jgi:hypothetical protein
MSLFVYFSANVTGSESCMLLAVSHQPGVDLPAFVAA